MTFADCVASSISKSVVLVEISLPSETKYYAKKYFTPVNSTHLELAVIDTEIPPMEP